MMKKFLTFIALTIIASAGLRAEVAFKVKAPERVMVGEQFYITYSVVDGNPSLRSLRVPEIPGCKLLYGPSESRSQSYEMINGRTRSNSRVDYTYVYRAEREGAVTIGEASVEADGRQLSTSRRKLTIVANSQSSSSGQGNAGNGTPAVNIDDISTQSSDRTVQSDDVFVRIILNKSTAYEQEAIECTIKLYTKYSISSFMPTKQPSFDGFLIEEVPIQAQLNEVENYRGQNYMTALLKRCIIFPQKSGRLTINSGNYDISVVQYDNVNMGFFNVRTPQERDIKVSSNSASIEIKSLPSPQPEGFSGAVGTFTIDSRLVGNSFRTNDPATLIYTVTGTGNIKYVKEPEIDFPSEFELYNPHTDYDTRVNGSNVSGTMTVEYTFVPQATGQFKIGSDRFVYFNPSNGQYVTLSTPVYDIKVAQGTSAAASAEQKDIESKNTDILHIKTGDKHPAMHRNYVIGTWWYWALMVLMVAGVAGAALARGKRARMASDEKGTRLIKANKVARRRLKLAKHLSETGQDEKFHEEILKAIWGYLSDKLGIPASQLTRENIMTVLADAGAPEEVRSNLGEVLDDCEMARYSPADTRPSTSDIYRKASQAINSMENIKFRK